MNPIEIVKGDITKISIDAIVNAANSTLMGGGGVDGAIHRTGGPEILEECRKIVARQGGCKIGEAVITTAGKLPSKFVIHTVGPIWRGGNKNESVLLSNCYSNSIRLAMENECKSIAFPNISTGVYGYPKKEAAVIATNTVLNFSEIHKFGRIVFVFFDEENYRLIKELIRK